MYHNPLEYSTQYNTMKITNVKYGRTYSLGSFQSERIDFEAELDDNETPEQALLLLKERCNNFHKETNKGLYEDIVHVSSQWEEPPPIQNKTPEERIIEQINQCSDIVVLKTFELLANKNPNLQEAYQNKLKQLQP